MVLVSSGPSFINKMTLFKTGLKFVQLLLDVCEVLLATHDKRPLKDAVFLLEC